MMKEPHCYIAMAADPLHLSDIISALKIYAETYTQTYLRIIRVVLE